MSAYFNADIIKRRNFHTSQAVLRVFTFMGGSLCEVIPGIATLPIWTATITMTILTIKTEEKVKKILEKQLKKPLGKIATKV